MKLPAAVVMEIEAQIGQTIKQVERVTGGCIHNAARIRTDRGQYFVKHGDASARPILEAEAFALEAMRRTDTVRVPAVVGRGDRWLLLEWLEPGPASDATWHAFGSALARLHRVKHDQFGWSQANFIGSLPQRNEWCDAWPRFWQVNRLQPQLELALESGRLGHEDLRRFEQLNLELAERLAIAHAEGASLLHGDLWSGNAHPSTSGIAAVDPSAYYGHREVDLAMAALFGGFPPAFWAGYAREWALESKGAEQRRAIYQLYYLLVHVNLFGAGYASRTRSALTAALK